MDDYTPYFYDSWHEHRDRLRTVIILDGVTSIGNYAFSGCNCLTDVTIPNSVTRIGSSAFSGCSGLSSITIPNSVTSIGSSAFYGCSGLTTITIPNSVTSIGSSAFSCCSGLTSIIIPNSVTSIGEWISYGCSNLTSITLPNSVTTIGNRAFRDCYSLTSITIPNSVTTIGNYAFENCSGLTSITIPNSVTTIGDYAFCDCSGLTSIVIPNSVTTIGNYAFRDCSGLTSITIPNSVTTIGDYAFRDCSGLTSITIPNSVTSIGSAAFMGCSALTSITIPNSVTSIRSATFSGCSALTSVIISNSVTTIEPYAFRNCSGLTSVTIPNSVTIIWEQAFFGCSGLLTITIPNSLTSIGNMAFGDCSGLTSINCEAITPPECAYLCFYNVDKSIPVHVPVSCVEKYKTAREWKEFTEIIDDQLIANPVIAKINAIGEVELSFECEDKIDEAIAAYEGLTDAQKALVSNYDILTTAIETYKTLRTAADKRYTDKVRSDAVIARINLIGRVEYTEYVKSMIDKAITAYNALTDDQKALVTNYEVLITAKQIYENLKAAAEKLAADKAMADPVIAKINAIGTVEYTYACKDKIDEANNAYNALSTDQKNLVTNLDVLTTAKQTYDALKAIADKLAADKARADAVIAKINAIGKVEYTDACKGKINDASTAYEALTEDQKALVTNLDVLTTAKQNYENLKTAADEQIAYKTAFENYKSELKAIIEALGKEDDSDAVKDIINKAISDIEALEYDVAISLDDNKAKINSFVTYVNEAVENQRAEDQKTTGINELQITNDELPVYDLNGKKITRSMLKSGLYIRNGKKVVVK